MTQKFNLRGFLFAKRLSVIELAKKINTDRQNLYYIIRQGKISIEIFKKLEKKYKDAEKWIT
jgi:predicted DNA-binding protein YlxM (UPF0122 family)